MQKGEHARSASSNQQTPTTWKDAVVVQLMPGLGEWITRWADRAPDQPALVFEGRTWTYAELEVEIARVAGQLAARELGQGARVAYLGVNHPALLVTFFACAQIGAAITPINWRLAPPEVRFIIEDAEAALLIYDDALEATVEPLRDHRGTDFFVANDLATEPLLGALGPADAEPAAAGSAAGEDMVTLMYTSGTSGRPKGAMISHVNMLASIVSHDAYFGLGPGHVALVAAPLFHIGGLNVNLMNTFLKGGTVVLERGFDPGRILELIGERQVNSFFAAPVMLQMLAAQPTFADADLRSLDWIYCGGAPVPPQVITSYGARGVAVCQGLGMTEATPMVATMAPDAPAEKMGSVGRPGLFVDVRVVDETGDSCPAGKPGEIVIRGANVISGYWNRPDANDDAFRAGWFHTGDVGVFDEDGYLFVVDRLKDMIISGGENVASAEVEACIASHPAVAEVAVVGRPHEKWGEVPVAYLVAAPGRDLTEEGLRAHVAERLARFKQPVEYRLVEALPRNAAGKILKHELRREVADSRSAVARAT